MIESAVDTWRTEGAVCLPQFIPESEIKPALVDAELLYGRFRTDRQAEVVARSELPGNFHPRQFMHFDDLPFDCSAALNLLGLHPSLIRFARRALNTECVHLYQCHTWAKFTGEADYNQAFHCDYVNHTLSVPGADDAERTINFVIYLTDVTDTLGAIRYVPLTQSDPLVGALRPHIPDAATQRRLLELERSGAAPAGSVFAYGIDVYHRGANLLEPGGSRYTLTASYKAAGNDMVGWSAWPRAVEKPWHLIMANASPEQLGCLGVPLPGHAFWTGVTLARMQRRWPMWDATPYQEAMERREAESGA